MRFPLFPQFAPIDQTLRSEITDFVGRFAPYSDFNFVSLTSYDVRGAFAVCWLNGNMAFRLLDYLTQEPFYTFIGDRAVAESVNALIALSTSSGATATLRLVPAEALRSLNGEGEKYCITEDPDSFDYIYPAAELISLANCPDKRRAIRSFHRRQPGCRIEQIDLSDAIIAEAIKMLLARWREEKHRSAEDVAVEFAAIGRCLALPTRGDLIAVGAWLRDELVGFTINEVVHAGYYMGHFGKASPAHRGLSDLLEHETAKLLSRHGCLWMNHQQDLGLPGLRAAKRSWSPSAYLRKATITQRA